MPAIESGLHRRLVALAAGNLVDDFLRLERGDHIIAWDEGIFTSHAQQTWRRQPTELRALLGQITPQPDAIGGRPLRNEIAEAAMLPCHVQYELRIARHALEFAQVANQPRILHQPLDMLTAHQHDLFRIETKKGPLE